MKITIQGKELETDDIVKRNISHGTGEKTKVTIIMKNGDEFNFEAHGEESKKKLKEDFDSTFSPT